MGIFLGFLGEATMKLIKRKNRVQQMLLENWLFIWEKMKMGFLLLSTHKINSTWIKGLNVKVLE